MSKPVVTETGKIGLFVGTDKEVVGYSVDYPNGVHENLSIVKLRTRSDESLLAYAQQLADVAWERMKIPWITRGSNAN